MTRRRTPSLEDRIDAIIARDSGMPYETVLNTFDISAGQFAIALLRDLSDYIGFAQGEDRIRLEEIRKNKQRKIALFTMSEDFLKKQYDAIKSGEQYRFLNGTYKSPQNVEFIIYYAMVQSRPQLMSGDRKEVVETIKSLNGLKDYFFSIGLASLLENMSKPISSSKALMIFDEAYQKRRNDKSLFDLDQKEHLHPWGDNYNAPRSYWRDPMTIHATVYHLLTENNPQLASISRSEVIDGIKKLPRNLFEYLASLGIGAMMANWPKKLRAWSPSVVLNIFDWAYQERTGDKSLFDLDEKQHLHKWGEGFMVPQKFWKQKSNVREAVYHELIENNPKLASKDRTTVIQNIKGLPYALKDYFTSLGLGGLMAQAFEKEKSGSPLEVLKVFDEAYRERTGDKSLFDQTQIAYLEVKGNRSIRKN